MEITGKGGTVRVAGRTAATLGKWSLEGRTTEWVVASEVEWCNPLWLTHGPFEVRLNLAKGQWRWRNVDVTLNDEGRGGLSVRGTQRWEVIGL